MALACYSKRYTGSPNVYVVIKPRPTVTFVKAAMQPVSTVIYISFATILPVHIDRELAVEQPQCHLSILNRP